MLGKTQARVPVAGKDLIRSGDSILGIIRLEIKSIMMWSVEGVPKYRRCCPDNKPFS